MQWQTGKGTLVLGGGGDLGSDRGLDLNWLERAGTDPLVVFLPTASGSRKAGGKFTEYYRGLGVSRVVPLDMFEAADAANPDYCETLAGADLIYIGGGFASRLIEVVSNSPALTAMTAALRSGAVVVAMSAGARAAGDRAIVRGNGLGALRQGTEPGPLRAEADGPVQWMDGFGWMTDVVVEPHLYEWNRLGHLFLAKATYPEKLVIGIDENTALVCRSGEPALVQGKGNVYLLQPPPDDAALPQAGRSLQVRNLNLEILAAGGRWEPPTQI